MRKVSLDVPVFSKSQVKYFLQLAGLDPEDLSDANLGRIGVASTATQRQRVISAYEAVQDVDAIFAMLDGDIPKSSIRAYLCQYDPNGPWRERRRRRTAEKKAEPHA
jgi:hypothetical protein